jgi:hypothetical protein
MSSFITLIIMKIVVGSGCRKVDSRLVTFQITWTKDWILAYLFIITGLPNSGLLSHSLTSRMINLLLSDRFLLNAPYAIPFLFGCCFLVGDMRISLQRLIS